MQVLPELMLEMTVARRDDFYTMLGIASKEPTRLSSLEKRKIRKQLSHELKQAGIENSLFVADTLVDMGFYELDSICLTLISEHPLALEVLKDISIQIRSTSTIQQAVEKTSKIVFALKSYARHDQTEQKIMTNICENIETVLTLYSSQISQGVELITEYKSEARVPCYADELNQVWVNLIHNALQAMQNKGRLTLTFEQVDSMVAVNIRDTGCGIPEAIQGQIFEPFFTTKGVGEGSGLGLDIVKRIVDKHNGSVSFTSRSGATVFKVLLPLQSNELTN
jgi:signal transduction histidine kinase